MQRRRSILHSVGQLLPCQRACLQLMQQHFHLVCSAGCRCLQESAAACSWAENRRHNTGMLELLHQRCCAWCICAFKYMSICSESPAPITACCVMSWLYTCRQAACSACCACGACAGCSLLHAAFCLQRMPTCVLHWCCCCRALPVLPAHWSA